MTVFKPALIYFGIVFSVGFLLGAVRVLWVAPQLGSRSAELVEMPLMLVTTLLAARWVGRRVAVNPGSGTSLAIGTLALGLLVAAEVVVGVTLRRESVIEVLVKRDPVSGAAYYSSLVVFGIAPWLMSRRSSPGVA